MKSRTYSARRSLLSTSVRAALAVPAAGVLLSAPVFAQQGDNALEEITVTATRRDATVQDVPINISAISATRIEQQGFDNISDLLAYVPGINSIDQGGRNGAQIVVRGLNADPLGQGEGNDISETVATYIGEVPIPLDLRLSDLNRVEVLLGPQGTLYGAGTLGGAIRYIPNKPDFNESLFEARADVYTISEGDGVSNDIGFTYNVPISETLAFRASLDSLDDQGYVDYVAIVQEPGVSEPDVDLNDAAAVAANLAPIEDANTRQVFSGRAALRWAPNDRVDSTLTYYFQNENNGGRTVSGARGEFPVGEYESASRVAEPNKERTGLAALEVIADLGFAELTSATGFGTYEEIGQRDQTDLLITLEYSYEDFPTFTAFTREEDEDEFFNQEVRLVSTSDSRINWIVGGFYNKLETVSSSSEWTPGYAAFAGFNRPDDLEYFSAGKTEIEESALYGEIGFDITDSWQITLGGRFYEYDVQTESTVDFPLFDSAFVAGSIDEIRNRIQTFDLNDGSTFTGKFNPDLRQKDDGSLFKFNTSYQLNDDVNLYLTISEGFRLGASNGGGPCDDFDPNAPQGNCNLAPGQQFGPGPNDFAQFDERAYGPDKTRNHELGVKSTLLDGSMTLNAAVFFVDWEDPQLSSATVNASIPITINANGAESKGVEVSMDWRASDAWRIFGTYSYTNSELSAPVPSLVRTIAPGGGFASAFEDGEVGDRLPGSPESQFSLFASHDWELANGRDMTFYMNYAWQGDVLSRAGARGSGLTLDSYGVTNMSLAYGADSWTATLYVNNVFDEYAESGVQSSAPFSQTVNGASARGFLTQVLRPRTLGVRFKYEF